MNNSELETGTEKQSTSSSEIKPQENKRRGEKDWRTDNYYSGITWAVILIIVGIIFLLNNLGIIPWAIWSNIWRFWPVFLILAGLQIILGRSRWGGLVIAFVTLLLCGGITIFATLLTVNNNNDFTTNFNTEWIRSLQNSLNIKFQNDRIKKTDIVKFGDFRDIKSRDLNISIGSGSFTLKDDNSADYFTVESSYYENQGIPALETSTSNSKLKVNFSTVDNRTINIFNIGAAQSYSLTIGAILVPTNLNINLGSGSGDIELDSARLIDTKIDVSSGSLNAILSELSIPTGDFNVQVSSGRLNLDLPDDIGLEVDYNISSGSLSIRGNNLSREGNFKSNNLETASKKVKITVNVSSGNMEIR